VVVPIWHHVGWPQSLDVPGVKCLVRVEAGEIVGIEPRRRYFIDLRALVLEASAIDVCVGSLEDGVVAERRLAENGDVSGKDFPQPAKSAIPSRCRKARRWVERYTNPFTGNLGAVDRKSPDVKRHVGQVVIVRRSKVVGAGSRIHPGRDAPRALGTNRHLCRPVESSPNWIQ